MDKTLLNKALLAVFAACLTGSAFAQDAPPATTTTQSAQTQAQTQAETDQQAPPPTTDTSTTTTTTTSNDANTSNDASTVTEPKAKSRSVSMASVNTLEACFAIQRPRETGAPYSSRMAAQS